VLYNKNNQEYSVTLKDAGISITMVETGGDPGHVPMRRTYKKLWFGLRSVARYF